MLIIEEESMTLLIQCKIPSAAKESLKKELCFFINKFPFWLGEKVCASVEDGGRSVGNERQTFHATSQRDRHSVLVAVHRYPVNSNKDISLFQLYIVKNDMASKDEG